MSKIEEFLNKKYKLIKQENFDDLLVYLKKGYIERKVSSKLTPVQYISKNPNGNYTLHFICPLVKYRFQFSPGVEFIEVKPDGLKAKALIIFEGNKLIHTQNNENGTTLKHVYEFYKDKMTITTTSKGLEREVKRHHVIVN